MKQKREKNKKLFRDVGQKPNLLTLQLYHYNDDE